MAEIANIPNRVYEIKIVPSKKLPKDKLTEAHKSTKGDGNYFLVELLAKKIMIDGVMTRPQKRRIPLSVFDSSDQSIVFNDILEALQDPENYTEVKVGDKVIALAINPTVMGLRGKLISKPTPGGRVYRVLQADGTPLKIEQGPRAGEDATRSEIRFFCHEEEDPDVRYAQELARIPKEAWIEANANDDDQDPEQ